LTQCSIDHFAIFRGMAFCSGWLPWKTERQIVFTGAPVVGLSIEDVERPDLVERYGEEARRWGFRVRGILRGEADAFARVALRYRVDGEKQWAGVDQIARAFSENGEDALGRTYARFLNAVRVAPPGAKFLEIGSRARSGVSRRSWFPDTIAYTGADVLPGENVDVVADAHYLSETVSGPFDFVYSVSTFEHLIMPWRAAAEIARVMRVGGLVYTQSHQMWPVHDAPWDFFRFSTDAWRGLFNKATGFEIVLAGMADPASCVPTCQNLSTSLRTDHETGFMSSVCLARKVGEPLVEYPVNRDLYDEIIGTQIYPA
jgi:hypothetical protein